MTVQAVAQQDRPGLLAIQQATVVRLAAAMRTPGTNLLGQPEAQAGPHLARVYTRRVVSPGENPELPAETPLELLRRYSNRDDLLKQLLSALERINEEPATAEEEGQLVSVNGPTPRTWRVSDRLSSTDIKTLVGSYRAGSTIRVLAEQYGIGTSSVKRLLREHGVRKQRPRRAA